MSRFNPVRIGRALAARRRNRWIDQARFCDGCSRVDDVSGPAVDFRHSPVDRYMAHAPRSFG